VDVFDFDLDAGTITNRRKLVEIAAEAGFPDGLTVDAAGYLSVAIWGGSCVCRYAPDGSFDREIRLPVTQVSSCMFGGPDLADLYITSAARGLSAAELAAQP
jgi:sugar lactone lactonase YvrE